MIAFRKQTPSAGILRVIVGLITFAVLCIYCPKAWAAPGDAAGQYPQLGSDGANSFYAIWESNYELYGAISTDKGDTWSVPQKLLTQRYNLYPQSVVYAGGEWVVCYRLTDFNVDLGAYIIDYVIRSADGINWTSPQLLYSCTISMMKVKAPASLSLADMASDNNNTVVAFTGPGEHVFRSTNGGETWTSQTLSLGELTIFGHDRYNVAYAGNQTWYISYSGNRAMTGQAASAFSGIHISTDNGQTWTTKDTTANFLMAGALAADGNELAIFGNPDFNYSPDGGTSWYPPATAQSDILNSMIVDSEGNWVAATKETFFTSTDIPNGWTSVAPPEVPGPGTAIWPVFATNDSRIGLLRSYSTDWDAWPLHANIVFQYSDDGGATWSTPKLISEEPAAAGDWQLFQ